MRETRIIQRNLVYVVGILIEDADIDYLRSKEMFGKYGVIEKVVLGNSNAARPQSLTTGVYNNLLGLVISRYLTFENDEDALHCIEAVDGFNFKDHLLKYFFIILNH